MLFLVGREDCIAFRPAKEIDPKYYEACVLAHSEGVHLLAYECSVNPDEISIKKSIKIILD